MKNQRILYVFDIDETLINWEYDLFDYEELDDVNRNNYGEQRYATLLHRLEPRLFSEELMEELNVLDNVGLALFTTGTESYAYHIKNSFFPHIDFSFIYGSQNVSYVKNTKCKNIAQFTRYGYDINNIILIDDKQRNGFLYPEHFIKVKRSSYYEDRNLFDKELYSLKNSLIKIAKKSISKNVNAVDILRKMKNNLLTFMK